MDKTKEIKEAEQAWEDYVLNKAGYVNPCMASRETLSDFKAALKEEIEKEIDKTDSLPITENTKGFENGKSIGYMKACEKFLILIDTVKPKQ